MKYVKVALFVTGLMLIPSFALAEWNPKRFNYDKSHYWERDSDWKGYRPAYKYDYSRRDMYSKGYYRSGQGQFANDAIRNGVRSGRLSNEEVRELRRDQFDLQRKEAAYRSDGVLTKKERRDLKDEREDFYKDLNHELKDGERRW